MCGPTPIAGIIVAIVVGVIFAPYIAKYPVTFVISAVGVLALVLLGWAIVIRRRRNGESSSSRT